MFSIIIVTHNREKELKELLRNLKKQTYKKYEIVIVNNGKKLNIAGTRVFNLDKNIGCGPGRNYGAYKARGDIFLFIDDDAELEDKNTLKKILMEMKDESIGILNLRVKNFYTGETSKYEFPSKDLNDVNKRMKIGYFCGCAFAIKKELYLRTRIDNLPGIDELGLSYKVVKAGYDIIYIPYLAVLHKKTSQGRPSDNQSLYEHMFCRGYYATKYLPAFYFLSYTLLWNLKYIYERRLIALKGYYKGIKFGLKFRKENLLDNKSIKYLKLHHGRLYK